MREKDFETEACSRCNTKVGDEELQEAWTVAEMSMLGASTAPIASSMNGGVSTYKCLQHMGGRSKTSCIVARVDQVRSMKC